MKRNTKQLESIKKTVLPVLERNDVVQAGIFGSYARSEAKRGSDVDMLVKFKGRKSLLDLVGLKLELEEKLKRTVDIVEYSTIKPLLRKIILGEEVRIL